MNNGDKQAYPIVGKYGTASGLTKRELLAAMAMQGLVGNSYEDLVMESFGEIARTSVGHADALLAELAKDKEAKS